MSLRRFFLVFFVFSCLLMLFFAPLATPRRAQALANTANDAITITSQSYSVDFPNSITFNASVNDANSTFVAASIVVNMHSIAGAESHALPIAASLRTLQLTWKEDTSGNNFMPPGSSIFYFWRFTDQAGNTFVEPVQQLTTVDTRFNWQHLTQGLLQVNWYNNQTNFGQNILNQASTDINKTSNLLGGGLVDPVNLWVYQTDADFHGSLPPGTYEWVGGIAFPSLDEASIVAASTSDTTLIRDMPHELTHLIFHQLIKNGESSGVFVPTWFDEGLAVYNQGYREPDMQNRLNQALATNSLLLLNDISNGFPANADKAYLAYAESWNLISYMFNTFGRTRMDQLIKDMDNSQNDFDHDLTLALGLDEVHLENQWRLSLKQSGILSPNQTTPTPQVTQKHTVQLSATSDDSSWILVVLGGVLVVGSLVGLIVLFAVVNRRRNQPALVTDTSNVQSAPYQDSAIYMQGSMYAGSTLPAPPIAPMQEYFDFQSPDQVYPAPQRQYPQE